MPLCEREAIQRFRREVAETSLVAFRRVALSPRWFGPGSEPAADVAFKALDDGSGCILLVDANLIYCGNEAAIQERFRNEVRRGWRPLAVIQSIRAAQTLRFADELLGLSGAPPHIARRPAPAPRKLVVPRNDVNREAPDGAHQRGECRFGTDLVQEARAGRLTAPLFRDREVASVVRVLSKAGKNGACILAEPGVGKTAIVEGLAVAIAEGKVPPALRDGHILDVNLSFLGAGASMIGEFEGRVKELVERARQNRKTILFLDELHTIRSRSCDASQMLKADLGRGRISVIGATTTSEWRQIEADGALARRFQVIRVEELTRDQTIEVLGARKAEFERHHDAVVPDELLPQIVDLSIRYLPDRQLPDKALDLLDEACACATIAEPVGEDREASRT